MANATPLPKRDAIWDRFQEGHHPREIAVLENVSYSTAYLYSRGRERGVETWAEYREIAKRTGAEVRTLKMAILGRIIGSKLKRLGKSKYWLAKQVGCHVENISAYAKGERYPKSGRLVDVLNALGIENSNLENMVTSELS